MLLMLQTALIFENKLDKNIQISKLFGEAPLSGNGRDV